MLHIRLDLAGVAVELFAQRSYDLIDRPNIIAQIPNSLARLIRYYLPNFFSEQFVEESAKSGLPMPDRHARPAPNWATTQRHYGGAAARLFSLTEVGH